MKSSCFAMAVPAVFTVLAVQMPAAAGAELPAIKDLPVQKELPEPLVFLDGGRVSSATDWSRRRDELKLLFQHYMYGFFPAAPERIEATVQHKDPQCYGGKATLKVVSIAFGPSDLPRISLLLVVPNQRRGPAAAFVGMNFSGNHALVNDSRVPLPKAWMYPNRPGVENNRATDAGRGKQADVWSIEQTIDRGYAVATFYNGDIDPDQRDIREGIQPRFERLGLVKPGPAAWGTLTAWAWGIHRAVDYLVTDPDIDGKRIAVVGHSRLGKTALLAAAFDERIALAIPHQAGCGGTAPSRGKIGESVKQINRGFPHWFNAHFKEFDEQPERLPFDQHCLVALAAPRPVLFSNAVEDTWANPDGQFEVLQAADPVYRFLGVEGLGARSRPKIGVLLDSRLGYFIREGKHSMTPEDWRVFLAFADRHMGRTGKK